MGKHGPSSERTESSPDEAHSLLKVLSYYYRTYMTHAKSSAGSETDLNSGRSGARIQRDPDNPSLAHIDLELY